ncbi:MAG: DciA family protein [Alcaligenaceae bacterium]
MVTTPRRPSGNPTKGSHLIGWLGHDTQAASVLATAQLHIKLRSALVEALPITMRKGFEVLKIEHNTLTLMVSSAAFAAKFRQLAPRVITHIQAAGWNLSDIKLRVQGGLGIPVATPPKKEARALDQQDLKSFEDLTHQLRPGPLADAVARLLAHHQPAQVQTREVRPASIHGERPEEPAPEMHKR